MRVAHEANARVATEARRRPKNRTQSVSFPHAMPHAHRPLRFQTSRCPITAPRRLASQSRKVRHGASRRIRAQHPTRMRVCIRKSSCSTQQLINQAINQQETKQQQLVCRSGNKPARSHVLAESNTISGELVPHAHRLLESEPRTAPLTQCVGSHPSHETCGMVSHGACVHNIRQR